MMNTSANTYANVDEYIDKSATNVQDILREVRAVIKKAVPGAIESMSYGMPAYKLAGKPLVYFGAFQNHIGFYATPQAHADFATELAKYKQGKGSVQFPLNQPIPYDLIAKITTHKAEIIRNQE